MQTAMGPGKATDHVVEPGRGYGVGRGLGVGEHLPVHGVGVGVRVAVGVGVGVGADVELSFQVSLKCTLLFSPPKRITWCKVTS